MTSQEARRSFGTRLMYALALIAAVLSVTTPRAQSVGARDTTESVRRALMRLPYYGVFDFMAFAVDRGTVTLMGYAYHGGLKSAAETVTRRASGVDEVANRIQLLPASQEDDRIRWATFDKIYTDDFLSRYAPGGAMAARYELLQLTRFPGMQPLGNYPIHIVVNSGRTTLVGVVDNPLDKRLAEVRAREVTGVFAVDNDLEVSTK